MSDNPADRRTSELAVRGERLSELAGAILDGTPIDWASAQSGAGETERALLDQLRLLATVADLHRDLPHVAPLATGFTATGSLTDEPARWGHLRVLEPVGRGAFGDVYRAWDTRLDREVALKLLPAASPAAGRGATTIIEEGRLLARVRHPNVVTIYGAERIDDRIGLWMEFVKGRTLARAVEQDGAFNTARTIAIGLELCRAVSAVHGAGLLHRDIKAQNVMLAEDGRVVLMDFGTGRELGDDTKGLAGTPLYLAPEVLDGAEASVPSDLYSVGVLLYYLLTGSHPVSASGIRELRREHLRGERSEIRVVNPEVSPKLARIIERAIDPRPEHRYESADALASSLAALEARPRALRLGYTLAFATIIAFVVWVGSERRARDAAGAPGISGATAAAVSGGTPNPWKFDPAERPVIAVLPLKNLSAEPGSDYFVDGLTDEMIRNLAVIDGLDVRSRTSSFLFKDKPRNLRDVAEQLGANLVLEGSVLRAGRRLRVNAQLVAVAGDTAIWSQRFDRELKDTFAIQDEISRAIVNQLRLTLGRGQRRYDTNLEAYELYLKARALVDRRGVPAVEAIELFREVIARDPAFAPAHAGLASAYAFQSKMYPYEDGLSFEAAQAVMRPAAVKAVQLDPLLAEAHAAMGILQSYDRDWTSAEKSFQRAIELNPALTHVYTNYAYWTLAPLGKLDEAMRLLETAARFDPLSLDVRREMALMHLLAGRYEQAIAELGRVISADPQFPDARRYLGSALSFAGRSGEAILVFEQMGERGRPFLSQAYALAGRRADAEKLAVEHVGNPMREARLYAALGDADRTFEVLQRMAASEPHRVPMLLAWPEMAGLRHDPRFAALRQTLHLPSDGALDRRP